MTNDHAGLLAAADQEYRNYQDLVTGSLPMARRLLDQHKGDETAAFSLLLLSITNAMSIDPKAPAANAAAMLAAATIQLARYAP